MSAAEIVVVGQIARDLVLVVTDVLGPGDRVDVDERREMLGGKGANIAVGLRQLGRTLALVGVPDQAARTRLLSAASVLRLDAREIARLAEASR